MRAVWSYDREALHVGSLGFRPDDVSVSFTVLRLSVSDDLKHVEQMVLPLPGEGDVQRFERQGNP